MDYVYIFILVGAAAVAFISGWFLHKKSGQTKITSAERIAEKIVTDAEREAETLKKEKILEAKDEAYRQKQSFDNEMKSRRNE